jgi:hypothetical protein
MRIRTHVNAWNSTWRERVKELLLARAGGRRADEALVEIT